MQFRMNYPKLVNGPEAHIAGYIARVRYYVSMSAASRQEKITEKISSFSTTFPHFAVPQPFSKRLCRGGGLGMWALPLNQAQILGETVLLKWGFAGEMKVRNRNDVRFFGEIRDVADGVVG